MKELSESQILVDDFLSHGFIMLVTQTRELRSWMLQSQILACSSYLGEFGLMTSVLGARATFVFRVNLFSNFKWNCYLVQSSLETTGVAQINANNSCLLYCHLANYMFKHN